MYTFSVQMKTKIRVIPTYTIELFYLQLTTMKVRFVSIKFIILIKIM